MTAYTPQDDCTPQSDCATRNNGTSLDDDGPQNHSIPQDDSTLQDDSIPRYGCPPRMNFETCPAPALGTDVNTRPPKRKSEDTLVPETVTKRYRDCDFPSSDTDAESEVIEDFAEDHKDGDYVLNEEDAADEKSDSQLGSTQHVQQTTTRTTARPPVTPVSLPPRPKEDHVLGHCTGKLVNGRILRTFARFSDIFLLIHTPQGHQWEPLDAFPLSLRATMATMFHRDYQADSTRYNYYKAMMSRPKEYLNRGYCVSRKAITHDMGNGKYERSGGDIFSACDRCFQMRRLCATLIEREGRVEIGFCR